MFHYFKFVGVSHCNSRLIEYIRYSYHTLLEVFDTLDHSQKNELFTECCDREDVTYIKYILDQGYIPKLADLYISKPLSQVAILESLQVTEQEKYILYKKYIRMSEDYLVILHPSTTKYRLRLIEELKTPGIKKSSYYFSEKLTRKRNIKWRNDEEKLGYFLDRYEVNEIRKLITPIIPYNLSYWRIHRLLLAGYNQLSQQQREYYFSLLVSVGRFPTELTFKDLWSIVPTDNEGFLWFLYYQGIKLPLLR